MTIWSSGKESNPLLSSYTKPESYHTSHDPSLTTSNVTTWKTTFLHASIVLLTFLLTGILPLLLLVFPLSLKEYVLYGALGSLLCNVLVILSFRTVLRWQAHPNPLLYHKR